MEVHQEVISPSPTDAIMMSENSGNDHAVPEEDIILEEGVRPTEVCALHGMLDEQEQQYLGPILVGYAFGPKKMSNMGVVMAEASESLSTVTMAATRVDVRPGNLNDVSPTMDPANRKKVLVKPSSSSAACEDETSQATHTTAASSSISPTPTPAPRLTSAILEQKNATDCKAESSFAVEDDNVSTTADAKEEEEINPHPTGGIKFSIAGGPDGSGAGGIRNIIRFFQSNCSSAASFADSSITDSTSTTAAGGGGMFRSASYADSATCSVSTDGAAPKADPAGTGRATAGGGGGMFRSASYADSATCSVSTDGAGTQSRSSRNGTRIQAVRVSFVPIDLDLPLEEQHGGKFDAILHKMTEDILYLSKSTSAYGASSAGQTANDVASDENLPGPPTSEQAKRVGRLTEYKTGHPACCLVDHPFHVQALMSRSEIARILSRFLDGVTTRSGIPAGTPRFAVVNANDLANIKNLAESAPFTFPMIVKPLPAAGTKASHHMLVVLNLQGLRRVHFPCILQEYENHGGVLFKVYVLGDTVRVFPRNSLPNLPRGEQGCTEHPGYVEFDSQRPYPGLNDFILPSERDRSQPQPRPKVGPDQKYSSSSQPGPKYDCQTNPASPTGQYPSPTSPIKRRRVTVQDVSAPITSPRKTKGIWHKWNNAGLTNTKLVTADEIRPIATALRKAFQLELFGVDILGFDILG
eukprot:CAMPEP_0181043066 /NCGR_PEP_ID=MMETSP1070-20121207/12500_1 /TAXON_ID=265543 /ORGANISM="Minutocellus polymorphus, Strain NH13" /LENGTH=696 /DNA_ID=CAMNT_0023121351 /DNA_START=990 /DNA_END=3077 /DNA_ORIENTATION=-